MSGFQQDDLFLHFGDCIVLSLSSIRSADSDAVLCSIDSTVCCFQPPFNVDGQPKSTFPSVYRLSTCIGVEHDAYRSLAGPNNKVWQVVPKLSYEKQLQNRTDEVAAEQAENQLTEDTQREQRVRVTYGAVSAIYTTLKI